jgi:hypothetical protein
VLRVLEVWIDADGDTLVHPFDISEQSQVRIDAVPTGSGVNIRVAGLDALGQILLERRLAADIRVDLIARIALDLASRALAVEAFPPVFTPVVSIDRFSDLAATFFRRSEGAKVPDPDEPIDFDELFVEAALGPNGEQVLYYNFYVRSSTPALVYFLVDRRGDPIEKQLPIFDAIPGEAGHNDFWQIHQVRVEDRDYQANQFTAFQELVDAGLEITPSDEVINAVMVPQGSKAAQRFDGLAVAEALNGWYRGQIVKYFLIETPPAVF